MKLEVEAIKENEDGSMDCRLHFDSDAVKIIMEHGLTAMINEGIEMLKNKPMVEFIDDEKEV